MRSPAHTDVKQNGLKRNKDFLQPNTVIKVYIVVLAFHLPVSTSINSVSGTVPVILVSLISRMGVEGSFEEQWGCINKVCKEVVGWGSVEGN